MYGVNTNTQYTDSLGDKWLERELRHVNLGDIRLNKRLITTSYLIERKASGSINQSCGGWKEAKGAYRLFSNEKLEAEKIYSSHHKETVERIKGNKLIFSIQDTRPLSKPVYDEKFLEEAQRSTAEYSNVFEEQR